MPVGPGETSIQFSILPNGKLSDEKIVVSMRSSLLEHQPGRELGRAIPSRRYSVAQRTTSDTSLSISTTALQDRVRARRERSSDAGPLRTGGTLASRLTISHTRSGVSISDLRP